MQRISDKETLSKMSMKGLIKIDKRSTEYRILDGKTTFRFDGDNFQLKLVGKENQLFLITN